MTTPSPRQLPPSLEHILLVRLDNMGDLVMCTPAMQAVRQAYPQAKLTLLTSPAGAQMKPHLDMVDAVITHRAAWVKHRDQDQVDSEAELVERLKAEHIQAAFIFTTATQSALPMALLCRMAGIPHRFAYSRENPYGLLSTWAKETDFIGPDMRHEVQRQLDLVAMAGIPVTANKRLRFAIRDSDRLEAKMALRNAGHGSGEPYVLIHPGATAPSRRYPPDYFAQAAQILAQAGHAPVFCVGPDDRDAIQAALSGLDKSFCFIEGKLSLGGLGALIEDAAVLIANNSGPSHIAAALGTPLVCLYALTNPQHTPWQAKAIVLQHDVPCRNCLSSICRHDHHACLKGVSPQAVADAALNLLQNVSMQAGSSLGRHAPDDWGVDHGLCSYA